MGRRTFRFHVLAARAKDGDTVQVIIDLGRRMQAEVELRLMSWDAPETMQARSQLERQAGRVVTTMVDQWLARWIPRGLEVLSQGWEEDKFGRLLGDLQAADPSFHAAPPDPTSDPLGICTWCGCLVASRMVQATSATGARSPWSDMTLHDIIQRGPADAPGPKGWHRA